jgi:hypothetical protein
MKTARSWRMFEKIYIFKIWKKEEDVIGEMK